MLKEDLRKWFSKTHPEGNWVRMSTKGKILGPCAREPGEGKPKCLPLAKARAMDKEDRAAAVNRKRREDPEVDRSGKGEKPVMVKTESFLQFSSDLADAGVLLEKNKPTNPELWSRAKALAKSKFDVYPSAYANGWAAKWYKSKGGSWKSVSEETSVAEENEGKKLNKPFLTPGGPKKRAVYVKNEKGNTIKVSFGDPNLSIKRDQPERKKSFRARHNCDNPGPKTSARYWSCRYWSNTPVSKMD